MLLLVLLIPTYFRSFQNRLPFWFLIPTYCCSSAPIILPSSLSTYFCKHPFEHEVLPFLSIKSSVLILFLRLWRSSLRFHFDSSNHSIRLFSIVILKFHSNKVNILLYGLRKFLSLLPSASCQSHNPWQPLICKGT